MKILKKNVFKSILTTDSDEIAISGDDLKTIKIGSFSH